MDKIEIDLVSGALNDATWKLLFKIQEYQEVEPNLFNNLKSCLKAAIEVYLNHEDNQK